jgi:hypothetical protein
MVLAAKGLAALLAHPPPLRIISIRRVIVHNFVNTLVNLGAKIGNKNEIMK